MLKALDKCNACETQALVLLENSLLGLPSRITFHLILTTALAKEKHKFSLLSLISRYCTGKTPQITSFPQDHGGLFHKSNKRKELRESDIQFLLQKMPGFLLLT